MSRLYIIGNGFDIAHGIPSSFGDFRNYVEENDVELNTLLDNYFDIEELWSDFEITLAHIDVDTILDDADNYLESYGAEDWSDAFHHSYQNAIDEAVSLITIRLKAHFVDWILSLEVPFEPAYPINPNSKFLTFNYTATLENTYNIDSNRLIHIHGKIENTRSELVLGHNRPVHIEAARAENNDEDTDVRIAEGNILIDNYFRDTYKNTRQIIEDNITFFTSLRGVNEIYVLGHSVSDVDILYFRFINRFVDNDANWTISYYNPDDIPTLINNIMNLGISESNISTITLDELE